MKKIGVLAALSDEHEKSLVKEALSGNEGEFDIHFPDSIASMDSLLGSYGIDIILLDYDFQNGALVDWLSLWPLPYVVFVHAEEIERLKEILEEEASLFVIREPSYQYVQTISIVINKVLATRELQNIQNRHLQISEHRYISLVQALPDIIYHIDEQGNFLYINDSARFLGYEPLELIGKHFSVILDPAEVPKVSKREVLKQFIGKQTGTETAPKLFDERRSGERRTRNLVVKLKARRGKDQGDRLGSVISYGEVNSAGFLEQSGPDSSHGTVGIIRDVTEKVEHEKLLEESLDEKTILLKEIHHRVKNNLQIILSLINLHRSQKAETDAIPILSEIQSEIYSMALVHDQLCKSDSVGRIDMQEYFLSLMDKLFDMYGMDVRNITKKVNAEGIFLRIEKATSIGLIVNELVSNAIKYAFTEENRGTIETSFGRNEDGSYILKVSDNGKGFSKHTNSLDDTSVGLQLVDVLVDQLEGTIKYEHRDGAVITITIPGKAIDESP